MITLKDPSDRHSTVVTAVTKSKNCTKCGDRYRVDDDGFPYCLQCGNREYQITVKQTEIKTPPALRGDIQVLQFLGGRTSLVGKTIQLQTFKAPLTIRKHTSHRISYRIVRCPFCEREMQHRHTFPIRNSPDKNLIFKCKKNHELKVVSIYKKGLRGWY